MPWRDMQALVSEILRQPAMVAYDNGLGLDLAIFTDQVGAPPPEDISLLSPSFTRSLILILILILAGVVLIENHPFFPSLCPSLSLTLSLTLALTLTPAKG